MIITHQREKLINAIIFFTKKIKFCGITKLLKLLYYLDFWHFKETGESVTGLDYYAWDYGPAPKTLHNELSNQMQPDLAEAVKIVTKNQLSHIVPNKNFDLKYFSKREKKLLNKAIEIFKTVKTEDIVEATHMSNMPWHNTLKEKGKYKRIDYFLAIDSEPQSISHQEALNRVNETKEMYINFGKL
ncbi:MAG: SocA family protein [Deltaproteobacteria bacterium]|nr:SocA family protein [Deltaproteobacteria bacterium]